MAEPVSPVFEDTVRGQCILSSGNTGANPLPVYVLRDDEGCPVWVSRWKLSERELEEVNRTGCVFITINNATHPPVKVLGRAYMENGVLMTFAEPDPLERLAK